ncbi:5-hydroxytryptamine receptor 3E [Octodon degus]|uniref:5-hydroxytryptamine receptor 3E n=1 Tax=Octodon degus TaxID=10160 RepID=A0A6P3FM61_OCTDE|nr:5-hydroxytryptamine receptor 3E [Octodon degus]
MGGSRFPGERVLFYLVLHLLLQAQDHSFAINCPGFGEPVGLDSGFGRKPFPPVISFAVPVRVNISFTIIAIMDVDEQLQLMTSFLWLEMVWDNPLLRWRPEECEGIRKMSVAARNLWLPDVSVIELAEVQKTPRGLTAFISNEGRIRYKKPMKVASLCNLDIFYFPFDKQNCTLTFRSQLYTADSLVLGMEKEVWEIAAASRNVVQVRGEWQLLSITKATPNMSLATNLHDQIAFHVAIRRRPRLYVLHLLVPSGFLVAIDALSFYLPAENVHRAPFKMALLLGYNVFLLLMNDLLPFGGSALISVYFALCLSLMVAGLLETIFITHLLHPTRSEPPRAPRWLYALLLLPPPLPHPGPGSRLREHGPPAAPEAPGPQQAEPSGCPGAADAPREPLSLRLDTLLFRLHLLFLAASVLTVAILWST